MINTPSGTLPSLRVIVSQLQETAIVGRFLLVPLTWLNTLQTNAVPSVVLSLPTEPRGLETIPYAVRSSYLTVKGRIRPSD